MNITSESRRGRRCVRHAAPWLVLPAALLLTSLGFAQTSPSDGSEAAPAAQGTMNASPQAGPGAVGSSPQAPTGSSPQAFMGSGPNAQLLPINAGDLIDVEIFNTPELSGRLRVDALGQVTLPLGGSVTVQGMTAAAAASTIRERLRSTQIMLDPSVTVSVFEYATNGVTLVGEVRAPGTYTLFGSHTLYDALAAAGGATQSQGASITITHAGDAEHPVVIRVNSPNYSAAQKSTLVAPGDTIVVSRADLVYIVGDVTHSGAFYMQAGQPLTILNLLSLAQGTNRTAAMRSASILRTTPNGATSIPFNLNKVMKNQEPNIALQAGDILVLPRSGWKDFGLIALPGLTNALAYAASNEIITH